MYSANSARSSALLFSSAIAGAAAVMFVWLASARVIVDLVVVLFRDFTLLFDDREGVDIFSIRAPERASRKQSKFSR